MSDLPDDVVAAVERLTRLARQAVDEQEAAAYREERDELLAEHGYVARIREEDGDAVLVCHPAEWVDDGTVRTDRIEDVSRGIERPLDGTGEEHEFDDVDRHNRQVVRGVEDAGGRLHADNASAFADFMGNHYVRRVESATRAEIEEFLTDYYPRNVWPTDEQAAAVEESIRLVFEVQGVQPPPVLRDER